nr:hypothetical protein [Mesorhizobium soli]
MFFEANALKSQGEKGFGFFRWNDGKTIIVTQNDIAGPHWNAAENNRPVHEAALLRQGSARSGAKTIHGKIGPVCDCVDVANGTVDDQTGNLLSASGTAQQFADICRVNAAASINDNDVAFPGNVDRMQRRSEVSAFAPRSDSLPEHPSAELERAERPYPAIRQQSAASHVRQDRHGDRGPALQNVMRHAVWTCAVDFCRHRFVP